MRRRDLASGKDRDEQGLCTVAEFVVAVIHQGLCLVGGGIVVPDVNFAVGLRHFVGEALHGGVVGHIQAAGKNGVARGLKLPDRILQAGLSAGADGHMAALLQILPRNGLPNAAGTAGDDDGPAG